MTDYLDEIQARADAASHYRTAPGRCACGYDAYKVGGFFPDYHAMLMNHLDRARNGKLAPRPEDVRRLVAALRAVEALCDAGDEAAANATRAYPEGEPDPGPPPAWVWADAIRTAIRDALEAR